MRKNKTLFQNSNLTLDMLHKGYIAEKELIQRVCRLDEANFNWWLKLGFVSEYDSTYYWVPKGRREEIGRIHRGGLYEL